MRKFLNSALGKTIVCSVAGVLILALTLGIIVAANRKFQNVTVELGQMMPAQEDFYTGFAIPGMAVLETDTENIDLGRTGQHILTFCHGLQREQVLLIIQDTTAPTVTFRDVSATIDAVLRPEDFVESATDLAPIRYSFAQELTLPENYGNATIEVVVTDNSGNATSQVCRIRYAWMHEAVTVEFGTPLEKSHLLLDPEKDADLVDQAEIDAINAAGVGSYTVTSSEGDLSYACAVTVQDTTGPELVLQDVTIYAGNKVNLDSFVVSYSDLSGDVTVKLVTELDNKAIGEQTVTVEATDIYGNITTAQATLKVIKDTAGPTFTGITSLTVDKNATIDYKKGVAAYDTQDGYLNFSVDTSKVNLSKAGTYYATYSATDSNGNKATVRRKISVNYDAADRDQLVKDIAASIANDPLSVRNYLANNIKYNANVWGEEDPVWQGLKNRSGNCYVQAYCLQALLQAKGYEAKVIWTTCKTHYWVILKYNGVWRHLDSTPGSLHNKVKLVTDAVRYANLQGRNWDRSQWPAAE